MQYVWIAMFVLAFCPMLVGPQGIIVQTEMVAQAAHRPTPEVRMPKEYFVKNFLGCNECGKDGHGHGSCVHASVMMLLKWQGREDLAKKWKNELYHGGEDLESVSDKADPVIRYTSGHSYEFLRWCLDSHRGAAVSIAVEAEDVGFFVPFLGQKVIGYHCVVLAYMDDEQVAIVDCNKDERAIWMSRERFNRIYRKGGGWAFTPVYTPPAPVPVSGPFLKQETVPKQETEARVLEFHATWCGPCKLMGPILDSLEKKYPGRIERVDIDKNPELANKYNVQSVPTIVILKGDEVLHRYVGVTPESVIEESLR